MLETVKQFYQKIFLSQKKITKRFLQIYWPQWKRFVQTP